MSQEMVNCNGFPGFWTIKYICGNWIMNTEEFPLLKYHNGQSSELFADGACPKLRERSVWYTKLDVGHAIALANNDLVVIGDQNRAAEFTPAAHGNKGIFQKVTTVNHLGYLLSCAGDSPDWRRLFSDKRGF